MIFNVNSIEGDLSKTVKKDISLVKTDNKYKTTLNEKDYFLKKMNFFKFILKEYKVFLFGTITLLLAILFLKPLVFIIYSIFAILLFDFFAKRHKIAYLNQTINILWIIHAILSLLSFVYYKNIYLVEQISSSLFYGMFTLHIVVFWLKLRYSYQDIYVLLNENNELSRNYIYRGIKESKYRGIVKLIKN